ncbi:MAG: DUF1818 family protein [Pseudanabaenaceae cyanobacterium bins.68]|nr:DUF1818 family protein [Pseudanabaenaceae cyanobacterium bins.68]
MPEKYLFSGSGWRIGWQAHPPKGLIGGDHWGFELTELELIHFCALVSQLQGAIAAIEPELADQEELACTGAIANLRLEVEGVPPTYSWYVCLECAQRQLEGSWPPGAMPELLAAIANLQNLAGFNSDYPPCDDE